MALQVWLPLNGNLDNLGLSDVTVTNNGATVNDNGKIGKCYAFTNSQYMELNNMPFPSLTTASVCFWLKLSSSETNWLPFTGQSTGYYIMATGNGTGNFYHQNSGSPTAIYVDGNLRPNPIKDENWHHYCIINVNFSLWTKFYINLYGNTSNGWNWTGSMNDVRIYDHCLSPKEVKEISKGLVLHYKLDDEYVEGTTNYLGTKSEVFSGWSSYGFGSKGIKSIEPTSPAISGEVCKVTSGSTDAGNRNIEMATWCTALSLEKNNTCTFSAYVKGVGSTIGKLCFLHVYNTNGTNTRSISIATTTLTGEWKRVSGLYTWTYDNPSSTNFSVYVVGVISPEESFLFCNPLLEMKDHVTPYVNRTRNNNSIIYDSSGYNNNGVISGNASINLNSSRYSYSLSMNNIGTLNHIEANPIGVSDNIFTVSFWIKTNKSINLVFIADPKISIGILNTKLYVIPAVSSKPFTTTNFIDNDWNHIVVIRSKTTYKVYINSVLEIQDGSMNYYAHTANKLYLLNRSTNSYYAGNASISDVRIYATALSDEDILELYNTSAFIDNSGNFNCYELDETLSENTITKLGIAKFNFEERDKSTNIYKQINPNLLQDTISNNKKYTRTTSTTEFGPNLTPTELLEIDTYYTFSALIRGKANMNLYTLNTGGNVSFQYINKVDMSETEFKLFSITFKVTGNKTINKIYPCTRYGEANTEMGDWFEIKSCSIKLEKGLMCTPWIPAITDRDYKEYNGILTSNQLIEI